MSIGLKVREALLTALLVIFGVSANAQSWENAQPWNWGDCVDWFRYEGVDLLANYAHPTAEMVKYEIRQSSPDIIVKINFEGNWDNRFYSIFKVERGYYNSTPFFKNVRVLEDTHRLFPPFVGWDVFPKIHGYVYREENYYKLYGPQNFADLPPKQKAACGLTMQFVSRQ